MGKWQPFQIVGGAYTDDALPFAHQETINYLPVASERNGTRSPAKLEMVPGMRNFAGVGVGPIRGMRDVEGALYVVSGTGLYHVSPLGASTWLGKVPGTGHVQMTHNQLTGGNQLVIATGTSGYVYDTRDDALITPEEPVDETENPTTPGGGEPSSELGPNGGYADDAEPPIPLPETFETDLIVGGDFTDPGDLDEWKGRLGEDLTGWTIAAGKAHFNGRGPSHAIYYPARYRMSPQPFPRYSVEITADVNCDAGVKLAVGMIVGYSSADDVPSVLYTSTPTEYLSSTPITHTFNYKVTDAMSTLKNAWVVPNASPLMYVYDESGATVEADFDNVTMEITELALPATTTQTLPNLDFSSGLDGWTQFPSGVGVAVPHLVGGALVLDSTTATSKFVCLANDAPLDLADELNKYVHIEVEAWCNDPSLEMGAPYGGVALGIVYRSPAGIYSWPAALGPYERGDWTPREVWARQKQLTASLDAGWTAHLVVGLRCKAGYVTKVRNIAVEVTDAAVT